MTSSATVVHAWCIVDPIIVQVSVLDSQYLDIRWILQFCLPAFLGENFSSSFLGRTGKTDKESHNTAALIPQSCCCYLWWWPMKIGSTSCMSASSALPHVAIHRPMCPKWGLGFEMRTNTGPARPVQDSQIRLEIWTSHSLFATK